jgi:sirohydrochlorin cobaltochelatase
MNGLLLFAHGARDPAWARPFQAVTERCRAQRPGMPVELAFLEFMSPTMVQAGTRLAEAGCTVVDVLPLFLGAGGHVRKDVPVLIAQLEAEHPRVQWRLHAAAGQAEAVIDALASVALGAAELPEVSVR